MVVAVGQEHHVPHCDHISLIRFNDRRLLADGPQSKDAHLRLVDDGGSKDIAECAHVGNRVGPSPDFVGLKCPLPGTVGEIVHDGRKPVEVVAVGISDHRYDEVAFRRCRRHADVDVLLEDDPITIHRGVDTGKITQRLGHGLDEEGGKGQLLPGFGLEFRLVAVAPVNDAGHICFHKGGHVRTRLHTAHHVIGDQLAHAVHLHDFILSRNGGRGR